jgi:hypothetical protein
MCRRMAEVSAFTPLQFSRRLWRAPVGKRLLFTDPLLLNVRHGGEPRPSRGSALAILDTHHTRNILIGMTFGFSRFSGKAAACLLRRFLYCREEH